jgi:hypothetical protein
MGPVELTFFVVLAIFAVIGFVRGISRELGVTVMLLIGLMVLLLLDTYLADQIQSVLEFFFGSNVALQKSALAIAYSLWMVFIAFISYEGRTLNFSSVPLISDFVRSAGGSGGGFAGSVTGVINGYLLAGTIWYYLACADWPLSRISAPFSSLYYAISAILPPVIFKWYYVVILIVLLLIIKVFK